MTAITKRDISRKFNVCESTDKLIEHIARLRGTTAAGVIAQAVYEFVVNHDADHERMAVLLERSRMGPKRAC